MRFNFFLAFILIFLSGNINSEEFIGVVFRDDEDGDISYSFNMAILDIDL